MEQNSTQSLTKPKHALLGLQILLTAFGATVLVPLLTGLDPNVALFGAGVGTLVFQLITRREIPIFLGSSFAFIPAMIFGVKNWGIPATLSGLAASGMVYMLLSLVVKWRGPQFFQKILPPIVTGPVIMLIGLMLAPVAVNMAAGKSGDGQIQLVPHTPAIIIALTALFGTILLLFKGPKSWRPASIIFGVVCGYISALLLGQVSFAQVASAAWVQLPNFTLPVFDWRAIVFIVPVAIAPAIEHFGDIMAIGEVTGKNYLEKPGLQRTLMGDGIASTFSSMLGGPPNTTYSEVTGAVAMMKIYDPRIMTFAAIFAIVFSFCGKLGALLQTVPVPAMGGLLLLLFGNIAVVGINLITHAKDSLMTTRSMAVISLSLVAGLGGMEFRLADFSMKGVGLAALVGCLANLLLPKESESKE